MGGEEVVKDEQTQHSRLEQQVPEVGSSQLFRKGLVTTLCVPGTVLAQGSAVAERPHEGHRMKEMETLPSPEASVKSPALESPGRGESQGTSPGTLSQYGKM